MFYKSLEYIPGMDGPRSYGSSPVEGLNTGMLHLNLSNTVQLVPVLEQFTFSLPDKFHALLCSLRVYALTK